MWCCFEGSVVWQCAAKCCNLIPQSKQSPALLWMGKRNKMPRRESPTLRAQDVLCDRMIKGELPAHCVNAKSNYGGPAPRREASSCRQWRSWREQRGQKCERRRWKKVRVSVYSASNQPCLEHLSLSFTKSAFTASHAHSCTRVSADDENTLNWKNKNFGLQGSGYFYSTRMIKCLAGGQRRLNSAPCDGTHPR